LFGLTRQEVVARLVEPPKTNYFKEFDLVYDLGPEGGFMGIDAEWPVLTAARAGEGRLGLARRGVSRQYLVANNNCPFEAAIWAKFASPSAASASI
jgi:hypothetical protein